MAKRKAETAAPAVIVISSSSEDEDAHVAAPAATHGGGSTKPGARQNGRALPQSLPKVTRQPLAFTASQSSLGASQHSGSQHPASPPARSEAPVSRLQSQSPVADTGGDGQGRMAKVPRLSRPPLHSGARQASEPAPPPLATGDQAFAAAAASASRPPVDGGGDDGALWIDKHAPRTSDDLLLAVHKKKVGELRDWMSHQLPGAWQRSYCRLAIVTGPPGSCKSCTIRVLASELGLEIVEWTPPAPNAWSEYRYQASMDRSSKYTSKLEEFEMFVARAKFPALSLSSGGSSPPRRPGAMPPPHGGAQPTKLNRPVPKLMLIDDMPHAADADARHRLTDALRDLASTSRCPVVLVTTDGSATASGAGPGGGLFGTSGASAAAGSAKGLHKEVLAALQ
ncbi:hypothetical protein FOA52_005378, partial [Chlamydomonas sp. UWO 241]